MNSNVWNDEAATMMSIEMSWSDMINDLLVGDAHPPLYYFTVKIILKNIVIFFDLGSIIDSTEIGADVMDSKVMIISVIMLLFVSIIQEKGKVLEE